MLSILKKKYSLQEQSKLKVPLVTATSAGFIRRLLFGILLINLLIIFLIWLSLYQSRLQYEKQTEVSTQNLARVIESDITNVIDKSNLALLAVKYEAERQLAGGGIKEQDINAYMARQSEQIPELLSLMMANAKGEIVYGTKVPRSLINVDDRDYFIQARDNSKGGIFISKPIFGRISGKWVVIISCGVRKHDGSFYGVVLGTLPVEYFSRQFAKLNVGKNGAISLRSSDISLIARYPESKSIGVSIGDKKVSKELQALVKSGQASGTYFTPTTSDNTPRTLSYSKVGNYPLFITVGIAQSEYLVQWWKEVKIMSVAGLIFTAIILLSSWLIYRDWKRGKTSLKVLEEQEKKYRIVADNTYNWEFWLNPEGSFIYSSPSCKRVTGYSAKDFETTPDLLARIVLPDDKSLLTEHRHTATSEQRPEEIEFRIIHPDGTVRWIAHVCQPVFDSNGEFLGTRGSNRDITERKKLEEQLRHAQKMEAIGTLAGGVAHDFNNILTAIIGFGQMAQNSIKDNEKTTKFLDEVLAGAQRAAELTHSLLAFSRKQTIALTQVNLNEIVRNINRMLMRVIGEDIKLTNLLINRELVVMADRGQIDQVILNLATNARDAMPDGGELTIETDMVNVDNSYAKTHLFENTGMYAILTLSDTGIGMDQRTMDNIFEPFFTTKEVGKGTGLGLSMAYGIIKQHGGNINVYSEPGEGTTFRVYLPMAETEEEAISKPVDPLPKGKGETILLAEDDSQVRKVTCKYLQEYGYKAIESENGEEAIKRFFENKDTIALVLLDVIMPVKNGRDAYNEIKKLDPDIKAIFMSGYTDDIISRKGILEEGINFISKPINPDTLMKKIREVLDR